MDGIALPYSGLPVELIEQHQLGRLVHDRGGELEIRFMRSAATPVLPVYYDGQYRVVSWGSRSGKLPRNGCTWVTTIESGRWSTCGAVEVMIPACAGLHNGIWYPITRGVKGVLAEAGGASAVYAVVEPSSYYYHIMTKASYEPVLIDQKI